MGYTHYWYREKEIPLEKFRKIKEDFTKFLPLFKALDVQLANGLGEGQPVITDDEITFNGKHNCGHPINEAIVIPWPSRTPKNGVATDSKKAIEGSWFAGVVLNQRACDGHCDYETFYFPRNLAKNHLGTPERQPIGKIAYYKMDGWNTRTPVYSNPKVVGKYFDCCKTAFRPYDLAVNVFLIIAKYYLKNTIQVRSDGDLPEWKDAVIMVQNALGYGEDFKLDRD